MASATDFGALNFLPEKKFSMVKREYVHKSWSRSERRLTDVSDSDVQREPDSDYSPNLLRNKVSSSPDIRSSPSADTLRRKKVYKKTRFSAEIPMIKHPKSTPTPPPPQPPSIEHKPSIRDTFRKIMRRLQGNDTIERKQQALNGRNGHVMQNGNSHNLSMKNHQQNQLDSYQVFNNNNNNNHNIDHHIIPTDVESATDVGGMTDRSGRESPSSFIPKQAVKYTSSSSSTLYDHGNGTRTSATSGTTTSSASTMTKIRGTTSSLNRRLPLLNGSSQTFDRNQRTSPGSKRSSPARKFYLGEDPFLDDHNLTTKPFRRKSSNGDSTDDKKKSIKTQFMNGVHNLFGGKLSKSKSSNSNSNQVPRVRNINIDCTDRGVQTLPKKSIKQVSINNNPASDQENMISREITYRHSPSNIINVSVVNNHSPRTLRNGKRHYSSSFNTSNSSHLLGPQKPARTYQSSLLRSKSFNIHLDPQYTSFDSTFKSNPQLHKLDKLDESPPPLKSPSIVTSINRSTRDLSKSSIENAGLTNDYPSSLNIFANSLLNKNRTNDVFKNLQDDNFTLPSSIRNKHKTLDYSKSFHGSTNTTPRKPTVSFDLDRKSNLNKTYTTLGRR